jgi:hypothetical protein
MDSESPDRADDYQEGSSAPNSRAYLHELCGQVTVISGNDFGGLANPFCFVSKTYCVACKAMVGLQTVSWVDSAEPISAYRRRLRASAPASLKLFAWVIGPLTGAALGAGIGWLLASNKPQGAMIGCAFALVPTVVFLMPALAHWVWGIDYRRME